MKFLRTLIGWMPLLWLLSGLTAHADVDLKKLATLKLEHEPIDMEVSLSGRQIYVLDADSKLLIYNTSGRLIDQMKVPPDTDQIKIGPRDDILFLSSRKAKTVQVLELTFTYDLDVSQAPSKGPADAPVTIVVFSDFQCPYCARIGSIIDSVRESFPGKVKSVFKHFPLSSHPFSGVAAQAAVAAGAQGKFWEFHDLLFQNYNRLNEQIIDDIRLSLNLDPTRFEQHKQAPQTLARIARDKQEGEDAGVHGTPTVFVNGRMVNRPNFDGIKAAVEAALEAK